MKDVIERMLKVEEEARAVLADAEKEAARRLEAARHEAADRAETLKLEAHAEATKRLEASRAELKQRREERLGEFDRADATYAEQVRPRVAAAAEIVVRRVLGRLEADPGATGRGG